uniref:NADH dehydrogenase subunit 4 n=1 Tax=Bothrogonia tibetana TaxID=1902982 RepID=UPI0023F44A22|nr:NADH dehydrogenase subunit 4 [Bothrogonia tibetana]WDZ68123.1 NADH dehydrogenase subunit 4 [Bothrogonia tibetana]
MKFIFYMFFLTPLFFYSSLWYLFQFFFVVFIFMMMFINLDFFYCCVYLSLGLDYISYGFILLTFFISSLMVICSSKVFLLKNNVFFLFLVYLLCFCLLIVFIMKNMFLMYLFFEFSLIPLVILVFGWGYQPERIISGFYLFFYTLFASLPLLICIIFLYNQVNSVYFDMVFYSSISFIFHFSMFFAFLVKFPMFMFHFWLPKAHVEAPISGSMILAGLMLSIGGYGMIRFMFICEYSFFSFGYIWYSFCLLGSFLVSLVCLIQGDMKCLIAYSSVSHMGLSLMGILTMSKLGLLGSYLLMLGHGLCSSGLFCLANICYERMLSRSFFLNKGMFMFMPSMCMYWFMFCSFNMGCPPSLNFISEILILNSMLSYSLFSFYYFFLISFFSSCFSFYLFSYSQHGMFHYMYGVSSCYVREYLYMFMHLFPLVFLILLLNVFFW